MDKFTQDAFDKAKEAMDEAEAKAFEESEKSFNSLALELTAITMTGIEMVKLISLARDNGLMETLYRYAKFHRMAGFKSGFDAGRKVMLEQF